ncbi:hypothetical protein O181_049467 [Austropuccinia psidii MF-1]|uniref:Uncharacterized protein n=1 Tax=Austropuccinia psidii MF-1 TaxID=1389203 RepID=A0A9Q3DX21_9BASI|nr:hypothetical protein [Austropuccinia psidii MF-1]
MPRVVNAWNNAHKQEYINSIEDIARRTKIVRELSRLDISSTNQPFLKKYKHREPSKPNNTNEQRKCHEFGIIAHFAKKGVEEED